MKKLLLSLLLMLGLGIANSDAVELNVFSNAVINNDAPDPSVVRGPDGAYYLYATGAVGYKSYNLADWTSMGWIFNNDTDPTEARIGLPGGVWACDINYINGKYVLYFAKSVWGGEWTCGIGVAISDTPQGPFHDAKRLFNSSEIGVQNSIDPFYIEDNGKKYLFWGSFRGIYGIQLTDDGLSIASGASKQKIAGTYIEGTCIHKRNGYYYLIGSGGTCCEGLKSTYHLVVARSTNLFGPYYDKSGNSALNNGFSKILVGNSSVKGPGHCSEIIQDDAGNDWMIYHGYDVNNESAGRKCYLERVTWDANGWPVLGSGTPCASGTKPSINYLPGGLQEKWNLSQKRGTKTQKGWDASAVRNFCYQNGKLYCVYNHQSIKVIDAQTGEDLGNLNETDIVSGGTLKFCDVKCFQGHIVACNLAKDGEELRIYAWDDDNAAPYLLYKTTDMSGCPRLGDCMEIAPDSNWDNNLWLNFAATANSQTKIVEFNRDGEGNWIRKVITTTTDGSTAFNAGASVRSYPNGGVWWIDGLLSAPSFFQFSGDNVVKRTIEIPTGETWGSCHHEFYFKGQKYAVNLKFNDRTAGDSNSTYKGGRMRLIIDNSGNYSSNSYVGEWPADGLGNDTRNTNGTGDVMINTDGTNYIEAWVCSTTHGMAYFTYGTVPQTNPSPILPLGSHIIPAANSVDFETTSGSTTEKSLAISAISLTGDISLALSGDNADYFTLSTSTLGTDGGSVNITYAPKVVGTHTASLTLTSEGADDVTVTLNGKSNSPTYFDDNITELTQVWTNTSWTDGSQPYARSIAFQDGKLYVVLASTGAQEIKILDAYTGELKGNLDVTGVSEGVFKLSGIVAVGGKIFVSNVAASTNIFKIYRWDSDTSAPVVALQLEAGTHCTSAMGNQISYTGDLNSGRIWTSDQTTNNLIYFNVSGGTISNTVNKLALYKADGTTAFTVGDGRGSAVVQDAGNGNIYVASKDAYPALFGSDGKMIEQMQANTCGNNLYGAAINVFDFGSKKYALAGTYSVAGNTKGGQFTLSNVTSGFAAAETPIAKYPADGFGTGTANAQRNQNILVQKRNDNQVLDVWFLSTLQGLGYWTYNGVKGSDAVEGIEDEVAAQFGIIADANTLAVIGVEAAEIELYNAAGVLVARNAGEQTIDVTALRGLYIVKVISTEGKINAAKVILR